ncbi:MAG: hypothetical protein O6918_07490, partial [Deltaproteobacteria bacterium]|nr:hypothetical protein [Deltaproteobacteria bacterium]
NLNIRKAMTKFKKGDRVEVLGSILNFPGEAKGTVCDVLRIHDDGKIEIDLDHTGGSSGKAWVTLPENQGCPKGSPKRPPFYPQNKPFSELDEGCPKGVLFHKAPR